MSKVKELLVRDGELTVGQDYSVVPGTCKYNFKHTDSVNYPAFTMAMVGPMGVKFGVMCAVEFDGRGMEIYLLKANGELDKEVSVIDEYAIIQDAVFECSDYSEAFRLYENVATFANGVVYPALHKLYENGSSGEFFLDGLCGPGIRVRAVLSESADPSLLDWLTLEVLAPRRWWLTGPLADPVVFRPDRFEGLDDYKFLDNHLIAASRAVAERVALIDPDWMKGLVVA